MTKKTILLSLLATLFIFCSKKQNFIFLDEDARKEPVWEKMLLQEKVKFQDVITAFKLYKSHNKLDHETIEHFEKLEKRIKPSLDADGYYTSDLWKYNQLLKYRKALPSERASTTAVATTSTVTFETPNANSLGGWKNIGPFGNPEVKWSATGNGAVQYIKMHPTNAGEMYACTRNGGLWKTVNYGKNWEPRTDHFATNNTSCMDISKSNNAVFYLGAAEDGKIWYSSDAGVSWEDRSTGLAGEIYEVLIDPTDAKRAITATTEGLYLTINSGTSWTRKKTGKYTDIDVTEDWSLIVVSDETGDLNPEFYYSKDKGDTFSTQEVTSSLATVDKLYMALHKPVSGNTKVFAYGIDNANSPTRFVGLWKSDFIANPTNGGSSFNFSEVKHSSYTYPNGAVPLIEANNTNGYKVETSDYYGSVNPYNTATWIGDFFVSPNDPNKMLTLREYFWGSEDGGVIWSNKPSYGGSNWADNRYVTMNTAKDTIFWCNDGGMWAIAEIDLFPTDAMVTASGKSKKDYMNSKVVPKNGDICVSEGKQMDVSQLQPGVFITGGQDIGQIFVRNNRDTHVASADVYRGRIKPSDDSKFIVGSLLVKLDGGTDNFSVYNSIQADHFIPERLYGFTDKNRTKNKDEVHLVRSKASTDAWLVDGFKGESVANTGGHSWNAVNDDWETIDLAAIGITKVKPDTFEQSRANGEIAFIADEVNKKVFITKNWYSSTPSWTQLVNAPKAEKYRIATHQYDENKIVLATDIGVFFSVDKGETWEKIGGTFPSKNPKFVLMDRNTSEGIYVATGLTVYYIDESFDVWQEFNKGLPLQNITDMRIAHYPNGDDRLFVSKYGRGVWSSSLYSVIKKEKPIASFELEGNSSGEIQKGEKVKLMSNSLYADALSWEFKHDLETVNVGNEQFPEVTLSHGGFYTVTLTATNTNGTTVLVKEAFIKVYDLVDPTCAFTKTGDVSWYKKIKKIKVGTDTYIHNVGPNYTAASHIFEVKSGAATSFYYEDSYSGYNYNVKAWVDYNNDGDFDDANEEIAASNGEVENFTANFTPPNNAVKNVPLLMRVNTSSNGVAPTACVKGAQAIDFRMIVLHSTISNSSSNITTNSFNVSTTYTNNDNVVERGVLYNYVGGDINHNTGIRVSETGNFTNGDSYVSLINDLEENSKVYYRSFVRTASRYFYGDVKSIDLISYRAPYTKPFVVTNQGGDREIYAEIYPNNNIISELELEYGIDAFDNSISFNPANYSTSEKYLISTIINQPVDDTYKFRVKYKVGNQTLYSRVSYFTVGQTHCTPAINETNWFRRIDKVSFAGKIKTSSGGPSYADYTSTVFEVEKGGTYALEVTDSYTPGYNMNYVVYIDYNNDGDFDDYQETVLRETPNDDKLTANITIPNEYVTIGENLRMRVGIYSGDYISPCSIDNGEYEDYSLYIKNSTLSNENLNVDMNIISMYPNPASDIVYFKTNQREVSRIDIFNENGKLVKSHINKQGGEEIQINIDDLPLGMYIVRLKTISSTETRKLIVR